jgi:murein DD-endopeptidase MepM/ murein hydrolase activator NlpD
MFKTNGLNRSRVFLTLRITYSDMIQKLLATLYGLSALTLPCLADESTTASHVDTHVTEPSFISPIKGKVISPFGSRGGHTHTGSDVKLKHGDTVLAACNGISTMAQTYFGYGKLIIIKHQGDCETYYSHLSKILIKKGDSIKCGQPIGLGGRTGRATTDHLHFEIRLSKKAVNAEKYIDFKDGVVLKSPVDKKNYSSPAATPTGIFIADRERPKQVSSNNNQVNESNGELPKELIIRSDNTVEAGMAGLVKNETLQPESSVSPGSVSVKTGDTLYSIAKSHGLTVQELQQINQLQGTIIRPGQTLKLQ